MMVHRRLYDIFVILIFVATVKLRYLLLIIYSGFHLSVESNLTITLVLIKCIIVCLTM